MTLTSLLLFSLVLAAPVQPSQPALAGQSSYFAYDGGTTPAQSFQLSPSQPTADSGQGPSQDVCYKIRAYIFKRDDDHAPEFVRSTTCGPSKPHTKDAVWPKARVVPAD
ncbi:MAG: hypothetical protein WCC87_02735 [Candidatus Korobacteraceae bacterium]